MQKKLRILLTVMVCCAVMFIAAVSASAAGSSAVNATNVTFGKTLSDRIDSDDEYDWYKVVLPSSGKMSFKITAYMTYYSVHIYDANSDEIWYTENNYTGSGMRSDTYDFELEKGTYYYKVDGHKYPYSSGDNVGKGRYELSVNFAPSGANVAEPNNSIMEAKTISFNTNIKGHIAMNDVDDYYRFVLTQSGRVNFNVTSFMRYYTAVLYDSNGEQVWHWDQNEWVSTTGKRNDNFYSDLEKGTYYLRMDGREYYDGYHKAAGNYNFTLTFAASGANVAEPNNSIAEAKAINFNTNIKGQIADNDYNDYYRISLAQSGRINFNITSFMQYYCAVLYNANGEELWYTDNNEYVSTTGKRSDSYYIDLEKGTYYLKINGYRSSTYGASTGNYNFTLVYAPSGATHAEPNDSIAQAKWVQYGSNVKGQIAINDRNDYYFFSLAQSGRVKFNITSFMWYYCAVLYDANGKEIWYTDNNEYVSNTGKRSDSYNLDLEKGTYYLKINGYRSGTYDASTGNYNFTLTYGAANASFPEPNDSFAQAKTISRAKVYNGQIAINDKNDYYKFVVPSTGKLNLDVVSYMQYYCAVIYNDKGEQIWYTDDNEWVSSTGKRADSYQIDLNKGTYYLKINGYRYSTYDASTGVYAVRVDMYNYKGVVPTLKASPRSSSVKLSWKKAKDADTYRVYLYNAKSKKWDKVAQTSATGATISGLKGLTNYKFLVKAGRTIGGKTYWSSAKKEISVKTLVGVTSKLVAKTSTSAVKLTWKAVKGATGYVVYRYDAKTKKYVKVAATAKTTYTVKKLKSGTSYKFAVKAYFKNGKKNVFSDKQAAINTATKPGTPKLTVKAGAKKAALKWSRQNCTGYQIYMASSKDGKYKKIATVKNEKNPNFVRSLKKGQTAYFKVRAYRSVGKTNVYGAFSAPKGVRAK